MRERVLFSTTHLGGQYAGVPNWVPVVACDTDKIAKIANHFVTSMNRLVD